MVIAYFAIMTGVGIFYRKSGSNVDEFVLGGRNLGPWLSAFSYGTTYFSAVIFVGYAGQFGWRFGMSAVWIGITNAFIGSFLAWMVLGRRTMIMTRHLDSRTIPDFLEARFDSGALKIAASLIIFIFMIPYSASLFNGLSRIFSMAFNVDYTYCVIAMVVLTGVYVVVGGFMASAINNIIQGVIMFFGILAVIFSVLNGQGGFSAALASLAKKGGVLTSVLGPDPASLLGVVILTSMGAWGLPQMVHKYYAIKSEKHILSGAVISTVFALVIGGGSYLLGAFGPLFDNPSLHAANGSVVFDRVVPYMLSSMPDFLIGVVVILVMSASMSTLSSLVIISSSTLTLDFIKGLFVKDMSEKAKVSTMRFFLAFYIVVSGGLALLQYTSSVTFIAQLMGIAWGAMSGSFLGPFFYGLFWKGATKASVWACFIFSIGFTVSNMFIKFIASPINAGAIAIMSGFVIVPLVSAFTEKLDSRRVESIFSCYDKKEEKAPLGKAETA